MISWLKSKLSSHETVSLPGEVGTVSLLRKFQRELDNDDSTLVFYDPQSKAITLRLSSISFVKKDGDEEGGPEAVRQRGSEQGFTVQEYPGKAVVSYEEEVAEEGIPLLIRY